MNNKHMDNIKAVFLDFDWTMFDHKTKSFVKEANDAVNLVNKQGVKTICNSARAYFSLQGTNAFKFINFDAYSVCNGLAAFTNDKIIYAHYLKDKHVKKLIKICEKHKISYLFSTLKETYENCKKVCVS